MLPDCSFQAVEKLTWSGRFSFGEPQRRTLADHPHRPLRGQSLPTYDRQIGDGGPAQGGLRAWSDERRSSLAVPQPRFNGSLFDYAWRRRSGKLAEALKGFESRSSPDIEICYVPR